MQKTGSAALVAAMAATGLVLGARPGTAQCSSDYMACAARVVTSSSDGLHDDTCTREYVACLGRMLVFY